MTNYISAKEWHQLLPFTGRILPNIKNKVNEKKKFTKTIAKQTIIAPLHFKKIGILY